MCMCACHSGRAGVCTCACARVTTLPTCPHGIVLARGICGQCEHAETEQALHRVMDERNAALARIDAVLAYIGEMGCFCPGDDVHASLPDHELSCFAQIEHLLTTPDLVTGSRNEKRPHSPLSAPTAHSTAFPTDLATSGPDRAADVASPGACTR